MLTIGQLARQAGMRTSALRYYENQGLLQPDDRSEAGYRLYGPDAVQRLKFIQRAQRLGFSLTDIKTLLYGWESGDLADDAMIKTAEQRYLSLERQITQRLVLRHELQRFLLELEGRRANADEASTGGSFDNLLDRVCADDWLQPVDNEFEWLLQQANCRLSSDAGRQILAQLRGQHVHIWREEDAYNILVISQDPAVGQALESLAALEETCQAHLASSQDISRDDEGYLFAASGNNAFLYARLFMALEKNA